MGALVNYQTEKGVAVLTLNDPPVNAYSYEMLKELDACILEARFDNDVHVLVVTGHGEKFFCAGANINMLREADATFKYYFCLHANETITRLEQTPKLVIAAINGVCVGAGAVIASACDLRIAAETARFGFIFPKVGLSGADMGASFLLPRIVGRGRAAELLFFGKIIDAKEADRIGFTNVVAPAEQVLDKAMAWARELAEGPAFAHSMTKQMLESEHGMSLAAAIEAEAQAQAICMAHPDFRAAYEANKKKERPVFEGAPKRAADPSPGGRA